MRLHRCVAYLWASPATLLGCLLIPPALVTRGCVRRVAGVIEVHGGAVCWVLRHCTLLAGGASALTLGHVVLGQDAASLDRSRPHERVHVRQYERWGPFFVAAYLLSSLVALCRRRDPYRDNRFEREAYETRRHG